MVLPHLTFLDISHNHLGELPGSFMLFLHLETLLVANNFLKVLPNGMQHLRHLHTVRVWLRRSGGVALTTTMPIYQYLVTPPYRYDAS